MFHWQILFLYREINIFHSLAFSVPDSMFLFHPFLPCVSNFNSMMIVKLHMRRVEYIYNFHNNFMNVKIRKLYLYKEKNLTTFKGMLFKMLSNWKQNNKCYYL